MFIAIANAIGSNRRISDPIKKLIDVFKTRVALDGGTFEAEQCLKDSLPALIENEPSLCVTPNAVEAGKLFSIIPTNGAGDLDVVRNTTATYVGADGLIKTALANEVRFDYSNGSCPSILVEPQRTNLLLRSEEFDNSSWTKTNATITPNTVISPSGKQDADTFTKISSTGVILQSFTQVIGTTYTYSIWVKGITNGTAIFGTGSGAVFGSINVTTSWQRFTFTRTVTQASDSMAVYLTATTLQSVYLWGAQVEAGSNATSYIPTTTTSVTRNADVISKTGISSLIGQTEGTIYLEWINNANELSNLIELSNGNVASQSILIQKQTNLIFSVRYFDSLGNVSSIYSTTLLSGKNKIAYAYGLGNVVVSLNGNIIHTSSSSPNWTTPINTIGFDSRGSYPRNSVLLFKTKLTNTQLQQLTTL